MQILWQASANGNTPERARDSIDALSCSLSLRCERTHEKIARRIERLNFPLPFISVYITRKMKISRRGNTRAPSIDFIRSRFFSIRTIRYEAHLKSQQSLVAILPFNAVLSNRGEFARHYEDENSREAHLLCYDPFKILPRSIRARASARAHTHAYTYTQSRERHVFHFLSQTFFFFVFFKLNHYRVSAFG